MTDGRTTDHSTPDAAIDMTTVAVTTATTSFAMRVVEGSSLALSRVRIAPGGTTGEHRHDCPILVMVECGSLTHHAAAHPAGTRFYRAGEAFLEGADHLHEGVNDGTEDVVLWMVALGPAVT
ncbi:hypothetical protein [Microbacterium sp. NPDC055665]